MTRSQDGRWRRICKRPGCGQSFNPAKDKQVYCSRDCAYEDRGSWMRPVGGTHAVMGLEPRTCPNPECPRNGAPFQPTRRNQIACSRSCRDSLAEQRESQRARDREPERRLRQNELRRAKAAQRAVGRRAHLSEHGWSYPDYHRLAVEQDGRCKICGNIPVGSGSVGVLQADHDHVTGQPRDLLCFECNTGLGKFRDDPARLRAAAEYIERHRATT